LRISLTRHATRKIQDREIFPRASTQQPELVLLLVRPRHSTDKTASLGTGDVQEAQIRLAEFVIKNETLTDAKPDEVLLETILIRYYDKHANMLSSAEQARYALAIWSDYFRGAAVSELTPQRQRNFIADLETTGYKASYVSRVLSVGRRFGQKIFRKNGLGSRP
jgi:hypothetical protein